MWCVKSVAERRYVVRMLVAAGLCVAFSLCAAMTFKLRHPHGVLAYLVAVLPALPIAAALTWTGMYLGEEKDEFQRNVLVQAMLGGTGCMLALATAWGYLEDFAHAPHIDLTMVYPAFWFFTAISYGVVKARYR